MFRSASREADWIWKGSKIAMTTTPKAAAKPLALAAASAFVLALAFAPAPASAEGVVAASGSLQTASAKVTIKSVNAATRHLVVQDASGDVFSIKVPKAVHNFKQIKAGDTVTATYQRETEYVLSSPNSPLPPDTDTVIAARAAKGEVPAGLVADHVVVTGAVVGIDHAKHTLKLVDPKGGEVHTIYVRSADGQKALAKMKVGDTITAYVTEALAITVNPA
jgi:hypothetical protein